MMELLSSSALTNKGAVDMPAFNAWLSSTQKDQAFILKQQRLLREEKAAEAKRRNSNQPTKPGGKGNKSGGGDKDGEG